MQFHEKSKSNLGRADVANIGAIACILFHPEEDLLDRQLLETSQSALTSSVSESTVLFNK